MPKISVIIPVYNAESWIERCARSLFEQTLHDTELIFVNDATPDRSMEILQNVASNYQNWGGMMRIITHETNMGVAAARTSGMKVATGEYMIHSDPDDWIDPEMFEIMYNKAKETNADIVMCDHYEVSGGTTIERHNSYYSNNPRECIKHFHEKPFSTFLFTTLIDRELIQNNKIFPFAGINSGEDLNVLLRALYYAKYIVFINNPLYHYNRHMGSLSLRDNYDKSFTINIVPNVNGICKFFEERNVGNEYSTPLNYIKFQKKMFLLLGKNPQLNKWWRIWPESCDDISKYTSMPKKTRVIYSAFSKSYLLLWLYFKFVRKLFR